MYLFIQPAIDEHLGYFQLEVFIESAAMNICVGVLPGSRVAVMGMFIF